MREGAVPSPRAAVLQLARVPSLTMQRSRTRLPPAAPWTAGASRPRAAALLAVGLVGALGVTACGSGSPDAPTTAQPAPAPGAFKAAQLAATREEQVRTAMRQDGSYARFRVTSVDVLGEIVVLRTRLAPTASNGPEFLGACSAAEVDAWVTNVEVRGSDDVGHTLVQNEVCKTLGL